MTVFRYNSDLTSGSLQTRECRIIADLLLQTLDEAAWQRALFEENMLQKRTLATVRRISSALKKRLAHLSPCFWKVLRDGDDELATQVAFSAALSHNLLLVEFVETVIKDAFITHAEQIATWQWHDFLDERTQRDPSLLTLSEQTREKMRSTAFRMLAEVGLLESTRSLILRPIKIRPELRKLAEQQGLERLINCINVARD